MSILNQPHSVNRGPQFSFRSPRRTRLNLICESLEHRQLLSADAVVASSSQVTAQPSLDVIPLAPPGRPAIHRSKFRQHME